MPIHNPTYQVAVYYFPGYHPDPRTAAWHGQGWCEWELLRRAGPRFAGHLQPKVPLWGYEDESTPEAATRKVAAAADHAVHALLFDWYWYDGGPFLNRCLEQGFLRAPNLERIKFALMWANHDWLDIHPWKRSTPPYRLTEGAVDRAQFAAATDYVLRTYLAHPCYWRVDGALYFSVYELMRLVQGLGGVAAARETLDGFRARVRAAGLGELHLNAVVWGIQILPGETTLKDPDDMVQQLGLDSVTSYVWIHHTPMRSFPTVEYAAYAEEAAADWARFSDEFRKPYYPNVSMGWDSSPRAEQSDVYDSVGYPFTPVLRGNTPAAFRAALVRARAFLDEGRTRDKILTINAWNEWTEGSYLEPDTIHGLGYLQAIREVFGA
jgi:hypothetical protein